MVQSRSAIVVVVDRLGAGYLGPYGNTWIDTPALNRLAGQSVLLENALTDSPRLESVYRSYWQGLHASYVPTGVAPPALPHLLADVGCHTTLLTDETSVAQHPLAERFDQCIALTPPPIVAAAQDVSQTQMAHLLAAAVDQIQSASGSFLLWVHARGMDGPWDAPTALRAQLVDEDDPTPGDFVEPPHERLTGDVDPDRLLGYAQAYAGQVLALDTCVEAVLDELADSQLKANATASQTMLVFTSPRGYPLGEHGRIGPCDDALYGELLHVPWLVRLPDGRWAAERCHELVQPADMYATLADWFGVTPSGPNPCSKSVLAWLHHGRAAMRDRACSVAAGQRSIRTPSWFLHAEESHRELFAKPDDRWEINEVSARCDEVASQMAESADQFFQSASGGGDLELAALPEVLVHGLD